MKNLKKLISFCIAILLTACNQNPSLEKYFVESTDKPNFINLDVSPTMLITDKMALTTEQKEALKGFDKMNIVVLKKTASNHAEFETERKTVSSILKNEKYQELMKVSLGKEGGSISYVGSENHISEFIIAGNKSDIGLAVVRITGKDMNVNKVFDMVKALQSSNLSAKELAQLLDMFKNKF